MNIPRNFAYFVIACLALFAFPVFAQDLGAGLPKTPMMTNRTGIESTRATATLFNRPTEIVMGANEDTMEIGSGKAGSYIDILSPFSWARNGTGITLTPGFTMTVTAPFMWVSSGTNITSSTESAIGDGADIGQQLMIKNYGSYTITISDNANTLFGEDLVIAAGGVVFLTWDGTAWCKPFTSCSDTQLGYTWTTVPSVGNTATVYTGLTYASNVATGTAPFTALSTTVCTNLHAANSDALGGQTFSTVTAAGNSATVWTGLTYASNVATGTAPFSALSTTVCPNLHSANSDALGGATFAAPGNIGLTTPGIVNATDVVANSAYVWAKNGTAAPLGTNATITFGAPYYWVSSSTNITSSTVTAIASGTTVGETHILHNANASFTITIANSANTQITGGSLTLAGGEEAEFRWTGTVWVKPR